MFLSQLNKANEIRKQLMFVHTCLKIVNDHNKYDIHCN